MRKKRCLGITIIGYAFVLSSIPAIFVSLFSNAKTYEALFRISLPVIPLNIQVLILSIISLIIGYGYLELKKWSYWAMIIYQIGSFAIFTNRPTSFFIVNSITIVIILTYTVIKRNYFLNNALCNKLRS